MPLCARKPFQGSRTRLRKRLYRCAAREVGSLDSARRSSLRKVGHIGGNATLNHALLLLLAGHREQGAAVDLSRPWMPLRVRRRWRVPASTPAATSMAAVQSREVLPAPASYTMRQALAWAVLLQGGQELPRSALGRQPVKVR